VAKHSGLIDQIIARRHDENPEVRSAIADVLGAVDNVDGRSAAEALLALLADPRAKRQANRALVKLGSRSDAALELLLAAFPDADEETRGAIVGIIGEINLPPKERVGLFDFQFNLATATDKLGKVAERIVPLLDGALDDPASSVSETACQMLAAIRSPSEKGSLINALRSPREKTREEAAKALGNLGPKAGEAIPALVVALADKDPSVRQAAARALLYVGVGSNFAAGALAKAIALEPDDVDPFNDDAACVLPSLAINRELVEAPVDDTLASSLLPVLIKKLRSQDAETASNAQSVLIDLGFEAPQVIHALREVARSARGECRTLAKEAIEAIETEREERYADLTEDLATLRDSTGEHLTGIARSLCMSRLPPGEFIPTLMAVLAEPRDSNDEEAEARAEVATTLAALGGPTQEVMAAIAPLLKALHPRVRRTTAELLGSFAPESKEYIPELIAAARDSDNHVQRAAVTALGQMGLAAKTAAAPLWRDLFADPDDELVNCAAVAIAHIDPASGDEAVPILLEGLSPYKPENEVLATAEILGRLGPLARPALPVLVSFWQRTANYQLHETLATAILAIDQDAARAAGVR
jgi:HEAT repeat protein